MIKEKHELKQRLGKEFWDKRIRKVKYLLDMEVVYGSSYIIGKVCDWFIDRNMENWVAASVYPNGSNWKLREDKEEPTIDKRMY